MQRKMKMASNGDQQDVHDDDHHHKTDTTLGVHTPILDSWLHHHGDLSKHHASGLSRKDQKDNPPISHLSKKDGHHQDPTPRPMTE